MTIILRLGLLERREQSLPASWEEQRKAAAVKAEGCADGRC
jgi:hypothetical protein